MNLASNKSLSSGPTSVNMRNCQLLLSMHVKLIQKNDFVENVWPANSALLIYVSTNCVETGKYKRSLTTIATLSWLISAEVTRPHCVREISGSIPSSGKSFYVRVFCFVVVVVVVVFLLFCSRTHYLSQKFAILFAMLIYLVYLT